MGVFSACQAIIRPIFIEPKTQKNNRLTLTMKAIITIIFIIIIGAIALAFNKSHENKVESREVGVLLDHSALRTIAGKEVAISNTKNVARLYKRSNTRVTKALNFTTKKSKAKLA